MIPVRAAAYGLLALLVCACSPLADIVAYGTGTTDPPDPGPIPTATSPTTPSPGDVPIMCQKTGSYVAMRTVEGRVAIVGEREKSASVLPLAPECLLPGPGPIAPSIGGTAWVAVGGKVLVFDLGGACKAESIALDASAMAFVVDPKTGSELLYALVDGVLVVVDPGTGARTPIGKLAVPETIGGLAGTSDGRLFAVAGREKPIVYAVRLGDAAATAVAGVPISRPADETLVGLALTPNTAAIVTEGAILWADPKWSATDRIEHGLASVVAAGAAPCGTVPF